MRRTGPASDARGFEQRLQQVLEKRARRVKGDRAVEGVIQLPFAEAIDRLQELVEQCRPLILLRQLRRRAGAEQCPDLADRHAAIEPVTMSRMRSMWVSSYSRCPLAVRSGTISP